MPTTGDRRGGSNRVEGNDFRGPTQIQQGGTGNRQTYVAGLSYRAVAATETRNRG